MELTVLELMAFEPTVLEITVFEPTVFELTVIEPTILKPIAILFVRRRRPIDRNRGGGVSTSLAVKRSAPAWGRSLLCTASGVAQSAEQIGAAQAAKQMGTVPFPQALSVRYPAILLIASAGQAGTELECEKPHPSSGFVEIMTGPVRHFKRLAEKLRET